MNGSQYIKTLSENIIPLHEETTFNEAFAQARRDGKMEFEWDGKTYHTRRDTETPEFHQAKMRLIRHIRMNSDSSYELPDDRQTLTAVDKEVLRNNINKLGDGEKQAFQQLENIQRQRWEETIDNAEYGELTVEQLSRYFQQQGENKSPEDVYEMLVTPGSHSEEVWRLYNELYSRIQDHYAQNPQNNARQQNNQQGNTQNQPQDQEEQG